MVGWLKRIIKQRQETQAEIRKLDAVRETEREMRYRRMSDAAFELMNLSHGEARRRFFAEVDAGAIDVEYTVAGSNNTMLAGLPDSVRDLFSMVARVEVKRYELVIDRDQIKPVDWLPPEFVLLAEYLEHEYVLLKPPEEGIYCLGEAETEEDLTEALYPTIYHFLLHEAIVPDYPLSD
jgi:hypothetical protein